jgi:hypothetical protein
MPASILSPRAGDILLRGSFESGFELLDAATFQHVNGGRHSISEAIVFARQRGAEAIWQLNTDDRGRTVGEPFRLPLRQAISARGGGR